ncbi:MAG: PilZ domain-containing protein [Acidobacteriota bacterium]|nr:PilZ domain-containing protein [Acidobacteriota bacterium]
MNEWVLPAGRDATRTAVRFPLQLALRLETEEGPVDATTKDISSNGLLFVSSHLPRVGSAIEFTLKMPAQVMGWESDVAIHCLGRVVRHQHSEHESMAAAVIDEYFLKAS